MMTVKLFRIPNDNVVYLTLLRKKLKNHGLEVTEQLCPPSTADWVEFPFLRVIDNRSTYYGREGIDAFLASIED